MKLTFLGAAGSVTGSQYLVEAAGKRVLVDCGMFQERDLLVRNWLPFAFDPHELSAVLLTHAHLDHCGLLPRLVAAGYQGPVFATAASAEIAQIVVEDSGHIQEEDTRKKIARHAREGRKGAWPLIPLYTSADAKAVKSHWKAVAEGAPVTVAPGVRATWTVAGHILGAGSIRVEAEGRSVLFSGDLGRWGTPILRDPLPATDAERVVTESTYGDKLHEGTPQVEEKLEEVVSSTVARGGNIVIPAFAVERSHELLYYLNKLLHGKRIKPIKVFLDSPSAIDVTEVYKRHTAEFDKETADAIHAGRSPFSFPGLALTRRVEDSKEINAVKGGAVIIAGSGMCTGGRIKHHLVQNLPRPESTVLFVGFQGGGTLGRRILDGAPEVRIFGEMIPVRARVERIEGFSGHGDREELFKWISGIATAPRQIYVTHGEPAVAASYAALLRERKGWPVTVPAWKESVLID